MQVLSLPATTGSSANLNGQPITTTSSGNVGFAMFFLFAGLVCALVALGGFIMMRSRPEKRASWGKLALLAGILGLGPWNWWGGFLIGSLLVAVGSIMETRLKQSIPGVSPQTK